MDDFTVETVSRTTVVLEEGELEKVSEDRVRDVQDLFHDLSIEDYMEKVEALEETDMVEKEELEVDRMQQEYQEWVSWDRSKIMFSRPNTFLYGHTSGCLAVEVLGYRRAEVVEKEEEVTKRMKVEEVESERERRVVMIEEDAEQRIVEQMIEQVKFSETPQQWAVRMRLRRQDQQRADVQEKRRSMKRKQL